MTREKIQRETRAVEREVSKGQDDEREAVESIDRCVMMRMLVDELIRCEVRFLTRRAFACFQMSVLHSGQVSAVSECCE